MTAAPADGKISLEELFKIADGRLTPEEQAEEQARRAQFLAPETPEPAAIAKLRALLLGQPRAGPVTGVTASEAAQHCGRDELWAHRTLMAWRDRGDVAVLGHGRFTATDQMRRLTPA